jgi:ankyrin repeat protein
MTIACEAGAQSGAHEIVAALLQYRASPDRADACGNTPLMWACEANATSVAELLLDAGACPRRVNSDGDAALGIALKHAHHCFGSTPLVELIKLATDATHAPLLRRRVVLHGLSDEAPSSTVALASPSPSTRVRAGTACSSTAAAGALKRWRCAPPTS